MDEEHATAVKCLITGPSDTPYSGGAFIFDIYFPKDYPTVPPSVYLETTGAGA
jgi:baculoviral IAP repeat-containing protein 6